MSRIAGIALALLALAPAAGAQEVDVESVVLDNGMEFLLVPRTQEPHRIAAGWVAKVGSVNERPGITGMSHFFEHLMFKGTRTIGTDDPEKDAELGARLHDVRSELRHLHLSVQYDRWLRGEIDDPWDPANDTEEMQALRAEARELTAAQEEVTVNNEFDEVYKKLGGTRMNAFTSHDLTFFFISVPSNKLELWCWMESDRLRDSVFREFYSERDVVHEERRLRTESTPIGVYQEQFESVFWQSSPYAWPVIGWPSDLESYTIEQARDFYETYYAPNNLVGVIVGDFDPENAEELVGRYFGRLERGEEPPPVVTREVPQRAEVRMEAEVEAAPRVEVRYHTAPFGHPDEFPLTVLAEVLNGRTGRLYRSLVEEQELATGASAQQDSRQYAGYFAFSAECRSDVAPEDVEQAWQAEVERLEEERIGEEELQKVKNGILADSYRRLRSNFYLMVQLGYYEALGGWEYINESPDRLLEVTAEDIQRVAEEYFTEDNRTVALYERAEEAETAPADPDVAALDPQLRPMAKQALRRLAAVEDPALLRAQIQAMEARAGQAPERMRPLIDLIVARANERLAQLEGRDGGSQPDEGAAPDDGSAPAEGSNEDEPSSPEEGSAPDEASDDAGAEEE